MEKVKVRSADVALRSIAEAVDHLLQIVYATIDGDGERAMKLLGALDTKISFVKNSVSVWFRFHRRVRYEH